MIQEMWVLSPPFTALSPFWPCQNHGTLVERRRGAGMLYSWSGLAWFSAWSHLLGWATESQQ